MTDPYYNYVILGHGVNYPVSYKDAIDLDNVRFFENGFYFGMKGLRKLVARMSNSERLPRFVQKVCSWFIYPTVFKASFDNDKPLCFIFFSGVNYWLSKTLYLDFLRRKHTGCKMVLYYQDKVSKSTPGVNMEEAKRAFDLVYSYDQADCDRFGLVYHPTPYSFFTIPDSSAFPQTDVFFCGAMKDRGEKIMSAYERLSSKGLSCEFFVNYGPGGQRDSEGIHYNYPMDYIEYLQRLSRAKMVLDLIQEGSDGFTTRVWESIMFDKILLTENKAVFSSKYYNPDYMFPIDGDFGFLQNVLKEPVTYSVAEKKALSPILFLEDIEHRLAGE